MNDKDKTYYCQARTDLINFVQGKKQKILELGCGTGATGKKLKKLGKADEVVGIEIAVDIGKMARLNLDQVIIGNIETIKLPFQKEYFDYIIIGDTLEHLYDPWSTLKKVSFYLKKNGYVIASIPNIRYRQILKDLVFNGRWEYVKAGILDDAHIRFFTKYSIIKLFLKANFKIVEIVPIFMVKNKGSKNYYFNLLTLKIFEEFLTEQYIIKAQKIRKSR